MVITAAPGGQRHFLGRRPARPLVAVGMSPAFPRRYRRLQRPPRGGRSGLRPGQHQPPGGCRSRFGGHDRGGGHPRRPGAGQRRCPHQQRLLRRLPRSRRHRPRRDPDRVAHPAPRARHGGRRARYRTGAVPDGRNPPTPRPAFKPSTGAAEHGPAVRVRRHPYPSGASVREIKAYGTARCPQPTPPRRPRRRCTAGNAAPAAFPPSSRPTAPSSSSPPTTGFATTSPPRAGVGQKGETP